MTALLLVALAFGEELARPRLVGAAGEAPPRWSINVPANEMLVYTVAPLENYACRGYATGPGNTREQVEASAWAGVQRCLLAYGKSNGLAGPDLSNWVLNLLDPKNCMISVTMSSYWREKRFWTAHRQTYIC